MSRSLDEFIISDITAFLVYTGGISVLTMQMKKLPSKLERNILFVLKFPEKFEKRDDEILCKLCKTPVSSEKRTRIDLHRGDAKDAKENYSFRRIDGQPIRLTWQPQKR